jgi:hypothetical protein
MLATTEGLAAGGVQNLTTKLIEGAGHFAPEGNAHAR